LHAALPEAARLSREMVQAIVPLAAEALGEQAMTALVERELGTGAAERPPPDGPALVAHVLASNVAALALPAIALGCLAGAAVMVKSGRADPVSAEAFRRAIAAVDPDLAATVVTAYWPGGDLGCEDAAFARADVVVVTGSDATLAAVRGRLGNLVAHGPRTSVAAIARPTAADADAVALDVALHDQRGCLSPSAVYVVGDARAFARTLAAALARLAERLPPGASTVEERAAVASIVREAEWEPGMDVLAGPWGSVIDDPAPAFRPGPGRRTVRVHPLPDPAMLAALLPADRVECVGVAGVDPRDMASPLRARGVSRICPVGRMQRPSLSWPRGQRPPLGVLLGRRGEPELEIEE